MIERVIGKCNSIDIVFNRVEGNKWQTTFPKNLKGEYIIELWATNDKGITSYFATIRFSYNPATLTMQFNVLHVGSSFTVNDVNALFGMKDTTSAWKIGDRNV